MNWLAASLNDCGRQSRQFFKVLSFKDASVVNSGFQASGSASEASEGLANTTKRSTGNLTNDL